MIVDPVDPLFITLIFTKLQYSLVIGALARSPIEGALPHVWGSTPSPLRVYTLVSNPGCDSFNTNMSYLVEVPTLTGLAGIRTDIGI